MSESRIRKELGLAPERDHSALRRAEDKGYRQGFDAGLYAGLRICGLDEGDIRYLHYKLRIERWRKGKQRLRNPFDFSKKEQEEIREEVRNSVLAELGLHLHPEYTGPI